MGKLSALPTETTFGASDLLTKIKAAGGGDVNIALSDFLLAISPAWVSWTPTLVNLTLGNGTLDAKYVQIGKLVHFRLRFVLGSTSAVGSSPTFTAPVAANAAYNPGTTNFICGMAWYKSGSAQAMGSIMFNASASVIQFIYQPTSTSVSGITSTAPGTWATGDYLTVEGFYEAA